MVRSIHHINFIVRNLDAAVPVYERLLGCAVSSRAHLPERGVDIARFRIGDTWLVLVQPVRADTESARFLAEHGEGFFLLSLGVDSIESAVSGSDLPSKGPIRTGLDGWRIQDIDPVETHGASFQYCQEDEG